MTALPAKTRLKLIISKSAGCDFFEISILLAVVSFSLETSLSDVKIRYTSRAAEMPGRANRYMAKVDSGASYSNTVQMRRFLPTVCTPLTPTIAADLTASGRGASLCDTTV